MVILRHISREDAELCKKTTTLPNGIIPGPSVPSVSTIPSFVHGSGAGDHVHEDCPGPWAGLQVGRAGTEVDLGAAWAWTLILGPLSHPGSYHTPRPRCAGGPKLPPPSRGSVFKIVYPKPDPLPSQKPRGSPRSVLGGELIPKDVPWRENAPE